MPQSVEIPEIGEVEFPDSMTAEDIAAASKRLYSQSRPQPQFQAPQAAPFSPGRENPELGLYTPRGDNLYTVGRIQPSDPLRAVGQAVSAIGRYGGRVALGAAQDIGTAFSGQPIGEPQTLVALAGGIPSGSPEALSPEGTTAAGEPPKPLPERISVGAIRGVGEMAPALIGAAATGGATLPAWFAGQMGLSTYGETGDPYAATRQAAVGALMGQFSKYGSQIGEAVGLRAAAKLPAALENATIEAGKFAGQQAALNYLMTAGNLPELMQEPDKAIDKLAEQVGINLAFAAPHLPEQARKAFARDWAETFVRSPEYKRVLDEAATLSLDPRQAQLRLLAPLTAREIGPIKAGATAPEPTPKAPETPAPVSEPTPPPETAPAGQPAPIAAKPVKLSVDDMIGQVGENGLDAALSYFGQDAGIDVTLRGGRIIVPAADRARATGMFTGKAGGAARPFQEWLASDKALASHIDEATAKDIAKLREALGIPARATAVPEQPWQLQGWDNQWAAMKPIIEDTLRVINRTAEPRRSELLSKHPDALDVLQGSATHTEKWPDVLNLRDEAKAPIPEQPVKAAEAVPEQAEPLSRTESKSALPPWEMPEEAFVKASKFRKRSDERGEYGTVELEGGFRRITKAATAAEAKTEAYQAWQSEHSGAGESKLSEVRGGTTVGEQPLPRPSATPEPAISFPGIGSLREKQATAMELGKIRKNEPELWKAITQMFGTDQPAKISKAAKARFEQMKRPESSVGPGAASVEDPAFMPRPARLDFGNMARSALQSVVNAFRTKARQQLPELPSVSGEFLPDLGNRQQNKVIASEPTGVGRVPILGWLLDPRQRARTPEEIAILTWFHENAMGQAHVQALGSTFGTHFKRLFPRNERGEFTDVGRTSSAQSMHPSDVFEGLQRDPKSYVLSPEQRAAFEELMTYEQKLRELSKKYKLRFDEETGEFVEGSEGQQPYWTRGRVLKPGAEKRTVGGTMLGARQYFQKGRSFRTEQEGVEKGYEYPLNVDDRLLMRAGRLYKAMADRRLAKDPDLGGRWGGTPKYEESYVFQPAFQRRFAMETAEGPQAVVQHKIFPIKTANALNRAFGPHGSIIRKMVVSANNFLKGLTLGFDWGVAQIQGLTTMYKNPGMWADAQVKAMKAFVNKDVFAQYVRNNLGPVREYAQFGGSIGRLPEMMAGLERGEILTGLPRAAGRALERRGFERTGKAVAAIAEVPEAFGRQFQTFLDVAKIELWKARREAVPNSEWAREVQAIESQLQSGRMESIGVTPNQALVERMLLLAPSYYRGALNLIAGLGERGASGQTYRRAMGAYMFGTTATFVALGLAAGMTWDEIRRRLNPSRGDFLMVPVKTGNRTVNVGFGGLNRSLMRLAGEVAETSVEEPGNWKSLSPEKNPFVRWFRAHAAPIPATAWDAFSGRDYMGDETDIQSLGKRAVPLAIQELFAKEKTPRTPTGVATEVAASLTGLAAFPGKTALQEIRSRHREWIEKYPDASVREDFKRDEGNIYHSKYEDLRNALLQRDGKALMKAVDELEKRDIKLSKIKEVVNPQKKDGGLKRILQSTKKLEKEFRDSLNAEDYKLYEAALDERAAQWDFFREHF